MELKLNLDMMPKFVAELLTSKGIPSKVGGDGRVIVENPGGDIAEMHKKIKEATGLNQDTDYSEV